jgi:hypothetical protein
MKSYTGPGDLMLIGDATNLTGEGTEAKPSAPPTPPSTDSTVSDGDTFRVADHVRAKVTDDGLVVLDIDRGMIYSANIIFARIWTLTEEGWPVEVIIGRLASETGESQDRIATDVKRVIGSLKEKNMIIQTTPGQAYV